MTWWYLIVGENNYAEEAMADERVACDGPQRCWHTNVRYSLCHQWTVELGQGPKIRVEEAVSVLEHRHDGGGDLY